MRILAHRGASGYAPENTYAAFDLACDMHADAIETDIRLSADGVMICFHDEKVDRVTDGTGLVAEMTWQQLQQLNAAAHFEPRHAPQRIVRLDDFLTRYLGRISLCLEIKLLAVVDPLVALLRQRNATERNDLEMTSFEPEVIHGLRKALPKLRIGWLVREFNADTIEQVVAAAVNQVCPWVQHVTPELVAAAHARGLDVRVWGMKKLEDLQRAIDCGVDGTTLNWPDWAKKKMVS